MFTFRPAVRENVGLLIGLAGPSGGGKSYSAYRLATGLSGEKRFAVIDTESGRAKHYADMFQFDHADLFPPFRPDRYREAIDAAVNAQYNVIVVDQVSHEHAGEGGLLDWHDEELERLAGDDARRRDSLNISAWREPKRAHKRFVNRLISLPPHIHLILCFRAEQKIEMKRGANGKVEIVPKTSLSGFSDWIPICEKNLPYELTASFLLTPDRPGIPQPIKLQAQHRPFFPLTEPISEMVGVRLSVWATGGATPSENGAGPERDALLADIDKRATDLKLSADERRTAWATYCGKATKANVDVSALGDLLAWLKARAA